METEIEPLSDYQEFLKLLCDDDLDNIKKLIQKHNTYKSSKLSQLISKIIVIGLYSPSFELFDFYTDDYQSLNDYEKELLKSISKKQNIHPYCSALVSQYLYEVDKKHYFDYLSLAYERFLLSLNKPFENPKIYFQILLRLVIIHTKFNKQIGNTEQLHNIILEFPSKHHEASFYKILQIAYKNQILSPEETIKISKDYIEGIEDLYGMQEVIEEYINTIKLVQQKEKNQFHELVDIKKLQWKLYNAVEQTASKVSSEDSGYNYLNILLQQVNLLKEIDYKGTQEKRKELLRKRDVLSKQLSNNIPYHDFEIDIEQEINNLYSQLNKFNDKTLLLRSFLAMPFIDSKNISIGQKTICWNTFSILKRIF